MNLSLIGFTLDVLGKILLGLAVLLVHQRLMKEHRVDRKVIVELRREQILGLLGIVLIIAGFLLQLPSKF